VCRRARSAGRKALEAVRVVYVDFETQERVVKDSGRWFRGVIETNEVS